MKDAKVYFLFPEIPKILKTKKELISLLMQSMADQKIVPYSGYLQEQYLEKDVLGYLGNVGISKYQQLTKENRKDITQTINKTVALCHKTFPHPNLPIYVFVYPWFPSKKESTTFGGVNAFSSYRTIHLFLANNFNFSSLRNIIAHEWNHLVYYATHNGPYSLKQFLIMEGSAEVFREEIVGGKSAPWSLALTEKEIKDELLSLRPNLEDTGFKLYQDVFWGSKRFKRWTGYAIGYFLIRNFRNKHPRLSWSKILNLNVESFYNITK